MTSNGNEKKSANSRRDFLKTGGVVAAGMYLGGKQTARAADKAPEALALDGGPKAVTKSFGKAGKWPQYGEEEIEAVTTLLKDPNYGSIAKFEEAWKKHFGAKYVKAHCNGTSALGSAFFALELPPGSEVLVSSYSTWFPLVPARFFGIVPRFVDVDPKTFNIDIEDCKRRLTKETKAIMPVHWWGLPCEMDLICDFAKEHGLEVIEDCSHAHGASLKDTNIGNWGRVAGFSLQASKPLPSIEGGIGVYKDQGDYERATTYGNYDLPSSFPESSPYRKYQGTAFGSKLRMHPISAILADLQLQRLAENNRIVGSQVRKLNDRITQLPGLTEPTCRPDMKRVHYSTSLMFLDEAKAGMSRAACVKALDAEGVSVSSYGWSLVHNYPFFQEAKWWHHVPADPGKLPGCDQANNTAISLPLMHAEDPELVEQYAKAFEKVWAHRERLGKA